MVTSGFSLEINFENLLQWNTPFTCNPSASYQVANKASTLSLSVCIRIWLAGTAIKKDYSVEYFKSGFETTVG